ncbi:hypothetical protein LB519_24610 [Mesorhizobium sp. AD1-1]|uniref:hypothetical protein n=1 Tax=Mesorhizobium sp. AD1-1 TaxID=2876621 RepID=UPI001CD01E9A|nr:hypothetical protein [Mesorhizobium sp. AD1-1]MBZ9721030.1 hypothetical protein [Mesorhizobium sp. AD1-1]
MPAPILYEIVRQHVEQAAFLWTVYHYHLLHPDENPDMDDERLARLIERLEAFLDGARVAGEAGRKIAQQRFEEFPEAGELFVVQMLSTQKPIRIIDLDIAKVQRFIEVNLGKA